MRSPLRFLAIALIAALAAACTAAGAGPTSGPSASPSGSPVPTGIASLTGADDLVLRVRSVGGFVAPIAHYLDTPVISVYGDGTVIVPGPQILIYPGPALPNLQRARISPAGMQSLLEAARDAGLFGPDAHYDFIGIADAGSTEFTLNAEGQTHTISAYALMADGGVPQASPADPAVTAARAKLAAFMTRLGDLEAFLGPELGSWRPYEAGAVQLVVSPGAPDDGQGLVQEPIAWPLSTPLADFGNSLPDLMEGQRCGVVSDGDLELLRPLLAKANSLTPWTDAGASFGVAPRPLLPGEIGCVAAS